MFERHDSAGALSQGGQGRKSSRDWLIVAIAVGLLTMAVPLASADGPSSSCSVSSHSEAEHQCSFVCYAGGLIKISGSSTNGQVRITGSCGGSSVTCTAEQGGTCDAEKTTVAAGTGLCTLDGGSGSGSCAGYVPDKNCDEEPNVVLRLICQIVEPPDDGGVSDPLACTPSTQSVKPEIVVELPDTCREA